MRLTFLGTGTSQGVPMMACSCAVCRSHDPRDKRLRCSALLEVNDLTLVIDAGPDFRTQLLRENVQRLDAILLTHEHVDHIGGLDDVRAFNHLTQQAMPVYADERTHRAVRSMFAYAFSEHKYPGAPHIEQREAIAGLPFSLRGLSVMPVSAMHYHLPVLGYRIGQLAYITDASFVDTASRQLLQGCEVLVVNALQREAHLAHFTLQQALELIDDLKPRRAYLTHVSHRMGLYADVQPTLPPNVVLAYDGMRVEV